MRKLVYLAACALPLALLTLACQPDNSTSSTFPSKTPPVAPIPVAATEADADTLDALLQKHHGQVILIDFWATWCPPCAATFPGFVKLHQKYAEKGLFCVSVSLDKLWPRGPFRKEPVLDFLVKKNATFPNFIASGDEEQFHQRYGLENGIPYKTMFDKNGKRIDIADWTDAEISRKIESLLAK